MKTKLTYLFLLFHLSSFSQNESDNLKKYWFYRDRLKYFVIQGLNQGESCVSAVRNLVLNYKTI